MAKLTRIRLSLPDATVRRLRILTSANRSMSSLVARAIDQLVEAERWQVDAIRDGIKEAESEKLHPHSEAKLRIAKWTQRRRSVRR